MTKRIVPARFLARYTRSRNRTSPLRNADNCIRFRRDWAFAVRKCVKNVLVKRPRWIEKKKHENVERRRRTKKRKRKWRAVRFVEFSEIKCLIMRIIDVRKRNKKRRPWMQSLITIWLFLNKNCAVSLDLIVKWRDARYVLVSPISFIVCVLSLLECILNNAYQRNFQ